MSEATPTVGERLKAERERRGMSTQKVADEMHLDVWVIDALETDDYQRIGPMVYARGHLKRYASILGLPVASVASGSEVKTPISAQVGSTPAVVMRMPRGAAPIRAPWPQIASVALLAAVAAAAWFRPWQHRFTPIHATAQSGAATSTSATNAATAARPAPSGGSRATGAQSNAGEMSGADVSADGRSDADTASSAAASADSSDAAARPAAAADPGPAGAGHARLRLSFSADSWVEVHDATGRRVFAGNGRANSVQTISGEAPLTVYLGYAGGVQLEVNDRAVAIGPQFVSGDVARFEAGADGVLRRYSRPAPAQGAAAPAGSPHG